MILPTTETVHGEFVMGDDRYHGPEFADYLSASRLKALIGLSPLHARSKMDEVPANDAALVIGSAFHGMVLRPEDFAGEFVVAPQVDRRTKAGKAEWAAAEADAAASGRTLLKAEEHQVARDIADAVLADREAMDLLGRCDRRERAYFSRVDGLASKAKPDAWTPGEVMVDLKSMGFRATDHKVSSAAIDGGWAIQASWYARVVEGCGFAPPADTYFIVVEKARPHDVRVMRMPAEAIEAASDAIDDAIAVWDVATSTGQYHGLGGGVIRMPDWYIDRLRGGVA